jgi:hypothetical protein
MKGATKIRNGEGIKIKIDIMEKIIIGGGMITMIGANMKKNRI